jgi:hypothetical protein
LQRTGEPAQLKLVPDPEQVEQFPEHEDGTAAQLKALPDPTHVLQFPPQSEGFAKQSPVVPQALQLPVHRESKFVQVPLCPVAVQLWQLPVQAVSQQTPCAQIPDKQTVSLLHNWPWARRQLPFPSQATPSQVPLASTTPWFRSPAHALPLGSTYWQSQLTGAQRREVHAASAHSQKPEPQSLFFVHATHCPLFVHSPLHASPFSLTPF